MAENLVKIQSDEKIIQLLNSQKHGNLEKITWICTFMNKHRSLLN